MAFSNRRSSTAGRPSCLIIGCPAAEIWLTPNPDQAIDVHFGGEVEEFWDYGYHHINYKNYNTVKAVPYDMPVSGYQSEGVSNLRLWKAVSARH